MTLSRHVTEIEYQIESNKSKWFPVNKNERKDMCLKIGQKLGYGLGLFDDWQTYAQTAYGKLIIKNSQDSIGVVITAKEWMNAIRDGRNQAKVRRN